MQDQICGREETIPGTNPADLNKAQTSGSAIHQRACYMGYILNSLLSILHIYTLAAPPLNERKHTMKSNREEVEYMDPAFSKRFEPTPVLHHGPRAQM